MRHDWNEGQPLLARAVVGIVTRNRADILGKSITSALSQRGGGLRISVLDDASTDDTPRVLREFTAIESIRLTTSSGLIAARNHLMGSLSADFFVSLDDDAWFVEGDEIFLALQALHQHPTVGAVAFDILSPQQPRRQNRGAMQRVSTFVGCGHVLRLSAARDVGLYEPAPGGYGSEEKDLSLRLFDAGYEVVFLPGVHVWHDITPIARDARAQYASGVSNDLMVTYRRTPLLLLPLAMAAKFFQHVHGASKAGRLRACLRGFNAFARAVPSMWRTRRPVRLETLRAYRRLGRS